MADDIEQPSAENPPAEEQNPAASELEAQLAEMRDRMLRAMAETENIRRRSEREKQDLSQYAVARFARDMLQIADNFGRALAACPPELREAADPQVKAVIDGVEVTERQLLATLEQYGVKIIDTTDAKFDPNLHQAIAEVPGEGKPSGTIVHVVQTGYTIGERLLRPAMVTVARKEDGPAGGVDTKV